MVWKMGLKPRITQWNSPGSWVWFRKLWISQPQGKEWWPPKELGNGPFSIWAARLERSPGTRTLRQFQTYTVTLYSSVNILASYAETQGLHHGFLNLTSLYYGSKSTLFSETSAFNTFVKSCVPYVPVAQIKQRKRSIWVLQGLNTIVLGVWLSKMVWIFIRKVKYLIWHQTLLEQPKISTKWLLKYMAVTFLLPMLKLDR